MEPKLHVTELHTERNEWLKLLAFTKDEIQTFENRLAEIMKANSKVEVTAQVEHFQNQFLRQKEVMDILRHNVNESEHLMAKQIEANPVATDHKTAPDHVGMRDEMQTFEKIYNDLKAEFLQFAAKTF